MNLINMKAAALVFFEALLHQTTGAVPLINLDKVAANGAAVPALRRVHAVLDAEYDIGTDSWCARASAPMTPRPPPWLTSRVLPLPVSFSVCLTVATSRRAMA